MAVAWFLAPYERRDPDPVTPGRYCVMDDHSVAIYDAGGAWAETEVSGNHAIVKVRAPDAVILQVAADPRMTRVPKALLTERLSDLTNGQRSALRNKIIGLGYTSNEITSALGSNLGTRTLGEVLRFIARRRFKPRFDEALGDFVFDGAEQTPRTVESVDAEV